MLWHFNDILIPTEIHGTRYWADMFHFLDITVSVYIREIEVKEVTVWPGIDHSPLPCEWFHKMVAPGATESNTICLTTRLITS